MKEQLCWTCANACGGCPWSRRFEPVPGWTAHETKLRIVSVGRGRKYTIRMADTYEIEACPLYVADGNMSRYVELKESCKTVSEIELETGMTASTQAEYRRIAKKEGLL